MPTYEYVCGACGHELELFQNITEPPKKRCPACKKSRLKRRIGGGAGFLFKGSGFYLTDYRSDSYKKAAEADSKPSAAGAGSSDGSSASGGEGKVAPAPKPAAEKNEKKRKKSEE